MRNAAPLITFLLVFAGACLSLLWLNAFAVSRWWPFLLLMVTPWVWWMWLSGRTGLTPLRSTTALLCRLSLIGLLIITLAEPWAVRKDDRLAIVFAVDRSGSIAQESAEQALRFVERVGRDEKPLSDLTGIVGFGRHAAVQLAPKANPSIEELRTTDLQVNREGTDLAEALSLAAAMLPPGRNGRIVLATDGVGTEGNLPAALAELRGRDIAVDLLPIGYDYKDEVWLERLDVPRQVKEGETYEASVVLSSLQAGRGKLHLLENGQRVLSQDVEFLAGKNRFAVPIHLRRPGFYEYAAHVEPLTGDHVSQNNVAMADVFLKGQGQILVVKDADADPGELRPLVRALTESSFEVREASAFEVPSDPLAIQTYDCVILANVHGDAFAALQLRALHDAVYHHGVGLMMVGGPNSFGPGGWKGTPIEKALPVDMEVPSRRTLLNGALVLVLDHSGSMAGGVSGTILSKQQLANRAAVGALQTLTTHDWVGVAAFDSDYSWEVAFGPNSQPERMAQRVLAIGPGGGTNMFPALNGAVIAMTRLPAGSAAVKHIILLTDGQSQPGDVDDFTRRCREQLISVSTLGVGPSGDPGHQILEHIAHATGGRFYPVEDAKTLPRIMIREAVTLRQNAIRQVTFAPEAVAGSPVLKGLETIPALHGLVLTTPKERAELVLLSPSGLDDGSVDPVLAVHHYGVGRTAAFTSDLSGQWGRDWLSWDRYQPFVQQLITNLARANRPTSLQLTTYADGAEAVVQLEDHGTDSGLLSPQARIEGAHGFAMDMRLEQTGPRMYSARVPLRGEGRYQVIVAAGNESVAGGFAVPYSQEYLRFTANQRAFEEITRATGGRILSGDETGAAVFTSLRKPKLSMRSIVAILLQFITVLIPLDVAIRRIQLDRSIIKGWFSRNAVASGETMSALLRRKEAASRSLHRGSAVSTSEATANTQPNHQPQSKPASNAQTDASRRPTSTVSAIAARQRERRASGEKT